MKPILKWVGGKQQLLADIMPLLPKNPTLYVEPFVGGGAVLLNYEPKHALINDFNNELINVYQCVRDNVDELLEILYQHTIKNSSDYYQKIRSVDRKEQYKHLSKVQRAARMIYLNKTCYCGLYRVNSKGEFNVPYAHYKQPAIYNEKNIKELSVYLKGNVEICCTDFATTLKDLPKGSFVYLDPPYLPISTTSSFTHYTKEGFGLTEHIRLRDECVKLREQGIAFLQSNSDCEKIREMYEGFTIKIVKARRSINCKADGRGEINEVLITA